MYFNSLMASLNLRMSSDGETQSTTVEDEQSQPAPYDLRFSTFGANMMVCGCGRTGLPKLKRRQQMPVVSPGPRQRPWQYKVCSTFCRLCTTSHSVCSIPNRPNPNTLWSPTAFESGELQIDVIYYLALNL